MSERILPTKKEDTAMPKNIYEIINRFNHIFGEQPISIKPDFISDIHLYIQILYDDNVDIPANHIKNHWNESINSGKNYGMMKIWVTRDEKTNKPELILFNDHIYINRYIMPDAEKAKRFCQARVNFSGGHAGVALGSQNVKFSNKMLNEFILKAKRHIKKYKEWISTETNIEEIQRYAKEIATSIDTLKILTEIRDSQTKSEKQTNVSETTERS